MVAKVAIVNSKVVDGLSEAEPAPATVFIEGDRIKRVSREGSGTAGFLEIDAGGGTLIPGLIDMHVHLYEGYDKARGSIDQGFLDLFLANGVTTVRDVGGPVEHNSLLRREIASGGMSGPRVFLSGPLINGFPSLWKDMSLVAESPGEGRAIVQSLAKLHVDYLKIYNNLRPGVAAAVIDEAHKLGLKVTGHVGPVTPPLKAVRMGIDCLEHIHPLLGASIIGDALEKLDLDEPETKRRIDVLIRAIAASGTSVCPTLVVAQKTYRAEESATEESPELEYVPPFMKQTWQGHLERWARGGFPTEFRTRMSIFEKMMKMAAMLFSSRANVLAGSDTPMPYVVPGFSLHRELELQVRAGRSPLQALMSATGLAARWLGQDGSVGSIAEGRVADLVLLDGDPTRDIRDVSRIRYVVKGGNLLDPKALLDGTRG